MKCANCDRNALFEYKISKVTSVFYCGKDLPSFLNERKKAGLLTITEAHETLIESAIEKVSTFNPESIEGTPSELKKKATSKKLVK